MGIEAGNGSNRSVEAGPNRVPNRIVEVDRDADKIPSKKTFEAEKEWVRVFAQYLELVNEEFDEIIYHLPS